MIYYTVEMRFWRRKIGNILENMINKIDYSDALVNTKKEFRHSSPIKARKQAFSHYESMIEVLYEGLNKEYKDDYQARIDLQHYLDSDNAVELGNTYKFKISDDLFNGIQVYMVVDKPLKGMQAKRDNKYCIHGIRYLDYPERLDENLIDNLKNLFIEHQYYEKYNYTFEKELVLQHFNAIGGDAEFYFQTPFDWDRLLKEFKGQDLMHDDSL